ncbi:1521_t:CDS:2, partial [Entrophospora sp. SA101]
LRLCHYGKYEYVDDSAKICIDGVRTSLEVDKTDNKIIDKIIENNVKKLEPPLTPNNKPKENTLIILEGNKYYILFSDNTLEDKLEEIEKRIKQVEESTDKLEEIEKKIKQIEESTDKHFQLLMEKGEIVLSSIVSHRERRKSAGSFEQKADCTFEDIITII